MSPKRKLMLKWDDPELDIIPLKVRKKTRKPTIERVESQQKVIRKLQHKVADRDRELVTVRASRDKNKQTRKLVNRKAIIHRVNYERRRTDKLVKYIANQTYKNANEVAKRKLKRVTMANADYLNSVSSFPIILSWCKNAGINFDTFSIFILLNHYEWFMNTDGMFLGYSKVTTTNHLKKLVDRELAQCIRSGRTTYVSTELGKSTFEGFKKYHDQCLKVLMDNYEKQFDPKANPMQFRQRASKRKKDGDQQENTGGTTGS